MKSKLFVRPNLKLFLLGAILIAVANDLIVESEMQASARTLPIVGKRGYIASDELLRLRQHLAVCPSAEGFMRLSYCFQQQGDYDGAMQCLLKARQLEELEAAD